MFGLERRGLFRIAEHGCMGLRGFGLRPYQGGWLPSDRQPQYFLRYNLLSVRLARDPNGAGMLAGEMDQMLIPFGGDASTLLW